jgi:peroxiredoxin Q/BCP
MFGMLPGRDYLWIKKWRDKMIFDSMMATKHIPKALEAVKKLAV